MAEREYTRGLAAIVAVDVAGYSGLMGADEAGTLLRLKEHRAVTDPIRDADGGRIGEAVETGLEAIVRQPNNADSHSYLGSILGYAGEPGHGVTYAEKAL